MQNDIASSPWIIHALQRQALWNAPMIPDDKLRADSRWSGQVD
jgi:hypothetical protein